MDDKQRRAEWVESKRKIMRQSATFAELKEAVKAAVLMLKKDKLSMPTVWKEPKDIGKKHAVVHMKDRENAAISGYTQEVKAQAIFDIANGNVDQIEEV